MSEYTYSDVIIDPNDERVKVGEKYWFGYSPNEALRHANNGDELQELSRLNTEKSSEYPFVVYSGDISANFEAMVKPKELKVTCALDLDNNEKCQIGYLSKDLLPLVIYSKNNNVTMCKFNEPKVEYVSLLDSPKKEEIKEYLRRKWLTNEIQEVKWCVSLHTLVDGNWYAEEYTSREFTDNFTLIPCGNGNMKLKRRRFPKHRTHKQ